MKKDHNLVVINKKEIKIKLTKEQYRLNSSITKTKHKKTKIKNKNNKRDKKEIKTNNKMKMIGKIKTNK